MTTRSALADAVRPFGPGGRLLQSHIPALDALADALGLPKAVEPSPVGLAPPWMIEARRHVGVREVVGPQHNPIILGWAQEVGAKALGIQVNDDETPWCGLFMAMLMKRAGLSSPLIAVRAAQWGRAGNWGRELIAPRLGCVLVFTREGGGHVGLYVGEDATHYHVLGGNQSNSVSIARLAKTRLAPGGMRWPKGPELPPAQPVMLSPSGAPVSGGEA